MRPLGYQESNQLAAEVLRWLITRPRVADHKGPMAESFELVKVILQDDGVRKHRCKMRESLPQELKKAPELWPRVKVFLQNADTRCANCRHPSWRHSDQGCTYHDNHLDPCVCTGWVQPEF